MFSLHAVSVSRLTLVVIIIFLSPSWISAQTLENQFQSELENLREEFDFPGATAAYILPDGTVGTAAAGVSDVEAGTPMQPDSRMLAASIGKTFVGATVVALAQEGKLKLDDPIAKWLCERSWFKRLPNHETITIRHLLRHTSGLPDHVYMDGYIKEAWDDSRKAFQPVQLINYVLDEPALFPAGKSWAYSDTGYILLGLIIEEASNSTFYEEVIYRFIVPLRLSLTSPSDRVILPGLVAGYLPMENKFGLPEKTTITEGIMAWNPAIEWTGGGFASNPRDLVIFAKALFEGTAMNTPYLDKLLSAVPTDSSENPSSFYGAGVGISKNGPLGTTYGHGGGIPGYTSSMRYYPEHRIAVSFQINTDSGISGGTQIDYYSAMEKRLSELVINKLE